MHPYSINLLYVFSHRKDNIREEQQGPRPPGSPKVEKRAESRTELEAGGVKTVKKKAEK